MYNFFHFKNRFGLVQFNRFSSPHVLFLHMQLILLPYTNLDLIEKSISHHDMFTTIDKVFSENLLPSYNRPQINCNNLEYGNRNFTI